MDNSFKKLFLEGEFRDLSYLSDAYLVTDDGWSFDVHRFALAKENMYFRALFRNAENKKNIFLIHDTTGKALDQILYYIYTRTLPQSWENNWDLLMASDFFLLDNLKFRIKQHAMENISLENCFPMYVTSFKMNDAELQKFSYRYVQTHFQALINCNLLNFEEIPFECLKNILNDNNLCVTGEHSVWKCIERWVKIDPLCRLSLVPNLLKCLKTGDIDDLLAAEIIRSDIIYENPLYKDLLSSEYLNQPICSLDVLNNVIQSSTGDSNFSLNQIHRHPKCLHIIAERDYDCLTLYSSYDESIDLWLKLGVIDLSDFSLRDRFITVVGLKVYILDYIYNENKVFDLCTKECSEMLRPRNQRINYKAVKLGRRIFIIGGEPEDSLEVTRSVEFFDTEQSTWFDAAPMISPVCHFKAVPYQNKIFVLGGDKNYLCTVAQVYDADLSTWSLFAPPNTCCVPFHFLEYHGKLYIIGGLRGSEFIERKVEVFDIATESWSLITDLPIGYIPHETSIFFDQLMVFESGFGENETLPPVTWNEKEESWKPVDISFLKFVSCVIFSIDNDAEISAMLKEIRDPASCYENCF